MKKQRKKFYSAILKSSIQNGIIGNRMNHRKGKFLMDGIADIHELYETCERHNKKLLTPPRAGASWKTGCEGRRTAVKLIALLGGDLEAKKIWSKLTGYNERVHIENTFSGWKRIFVESLQSKLDKTISCEICLKSLMLNKMLSAQIR